MKLCEDMKLEGFIPVETEWVFGAKNGREVQLKLDEKHAMDFSGSIDRLDLLRDGSYRIVDYKTGKYEKKQKLRTSQRDDLIQDYIYAMVFEQFHEEKKISCSSFDFPCDNNFKLETSFGEDEKKKTLLRLKAIFDLILDNQYERCVGNIDKYPDYVKTCEYCDFQILCLAEQAAWEESI